MAERDARIEGARAEAATVEVAARQELDAYRDALRKARAEIYAEQETSRQAALDSRAQLLKAMRSRAQEDVASAKKRIAAEVAAARVQVEIETPALASNIARIILEKPSSSPRGASR
jgi:F0F1-type ATP synthase membrane subunit b/b'